ncbi:YHS domain-containing protein [Bosea sp. AAP35]|uniref:YHS domain-containing (seleno)protein n=1 Tax=Bosea sp. AAP35 TaxID=1523417 RepID=UPI0006B8CDFB|nr:YHS domain-containing (seleno)protein [Bosea sp. AAP35]KPF69556.1 YHS domain-containing protein [Bosea sp. AAP35]
MSVLCISKRISVRFTAASAAILMSFAVQAADEHFLKDGGPAISGYDAIAYHTLGKPTPGSSQFKAEYQGVTWQFASAANRDLFAANPAKYAPAYGGWCSAGASKGKKVSTQPHLFAVVDGQLYLNSTEAAHKDLFLKDPAAVIDRGERNWKVIYATPAAKL